MAQKVSPHPLADYIRTDRLPFIFCPGCSIGTIIGMVARAMKELNLDLTKTVVVSGIGCTGRASGYFNACAFHTTHGRAIPFATGVKLANPELNVIVISGDGDLASIGGNHLIHAARRNIDITVIAINNFNYGMTGGQYGPTTPLKSRTQTSPYGTIEQPFNLSKLAASAGATYVARWTPLDVFKGVKSIKKAILHKGFSFIEFVGICPTAYGRYNRLGDAPEMLEHLKKIEVKKNVPPEEADFDFNEILVCGEFVDTTKPELTELYDKLILSVKEENK